MKHMGKAAGMLFLATMMLWMPFCLAWADQEPGFVSVVGKGEIAEPDAAAARDLAVENALRTAVETAALQMASPLVVAEKFGEFTALFAKSMDPFVSDYKVLAELPGDLKYLVAVSVRVSTDHLTQVLKAAGMLPAPARETAKILVMISETDPETGTQSFWWGEFPPSQPSPVGVFVGRFFEKRGYETADPFALKGMDAYAPAAGAELTDAEAAAFAGAWNADLAILGNSEARAAENVLEGQKITYTGRVTLHAVDVASAKTVARVSKTVSVLDADPETGIAQAKEAAAQEGAEALAAALDSWRRARFGGRGIELTVLGTKNLAAFVRFRRALLDTPGVSGIHVKEMEADKASIQVDFSGTGQALAEALVKNDYPGFSVNVTRKSQGRVSVTLAP